MAATSTTVADLESAPTARVWRRLHLIPPGRTGTWRCLGFGFVVAWLPLFVLNAVAGTLRGGTETGPFAIDLATHVRLLLAAPLLVVGENVMALAFGRSLAQLIDQEMAAPDDPRLRAAVRGFSHWRTSGVVDAILAVLAFVGSAWATHQRPRELSGWALTASGLSLAGWWLALIALPLFQYALARCLWTAVLWCVALIRLARLPLRLTTTHPDGVGGLALLGEAQSSFRFLVFSVAAVVAAADARQMLYEGVSLSALQAQGLGFAFIVAVLVFGPMLLFTRALWQLRLLAKLELGALGTRYGRLFNRRWLAPSSRDDASLLGSSDIQSLADLGNSYQLVNRIVLVPIQRYALIDIAIALVLPAIPLVLIEVPLGALLKRLLSTIL